MKKPYIFLLVLTMFFGALSAQDISVSGRITSADDHLGIPGVTVLLKGTTRGAVSDIDGIYHLSAPPDGTLVFSYSGMKKQEIPINNQTLIDIIMVEEKIDLGEVIVVGYSTDSEKLITGSIALVDQNELKNEVVRTLDGVLEGKVAGITINPNSGTPGGQSSIKMRGGSSINASNEPLIVVDGIPILTGSYGQVGMSGQEISAMADINPSDIETVTILKDASATAIYGARASNGVILITTKKGAYNSTNVNLNFNFGWQQLPPERLLDMMDADQWNEYKGTNVQGINTDWMSEILQIAPTSNTELSISTGNKDTRLFLSANYYMQDGVVKGTAFDRYNTRLNVDHNLFPNLTIGAGISVMYSKNDRVEGDQTLYGPLPNAMSIPAIFPVYDSTGAYDESGPYANPVAIANEAVNQALTNRFNGNIYLEYRFLNDFTFLTKWGADIYNLREHSYDPITTRQGAKYKGLGIEGTNYVSNLISNNVIQYTKTIKEKHNIDALIGYSFEKYARRNTYIEGIDFPNEDFQYIASAGVIRYASSSALNRGMNSYFGQVKYNYLHKYLMTFTARADGSSKFGANNKYGFFPAASIAWRMTEESFMANLNAVSELKLRLSVGLTGNDGIGDFASLGLYGGGYNYGGSSGIAPIQLPNPDLKWETTQQTNIGFDFGLFDDRIILNADFYMNKTRDLLLERPVPNSSGFNSISSNIGSLENKGLELALNTLNIDQQLKWSSTLNFAANRNKVTSLYNNQPIDDYGRGGNRVEVGEPIGIFYGYNCLGVDPSTGDLVYEDINQDGVITADDRTKTGNPNPDFSFGFSNNLSYKSFELSIFLQGVYGNEIFNGTLIYLESGSGEDNQTTNILRRWQKPGDITDVPRVGDSYKSSRYIEDGSFMRIKNVTLSYNFSKRLLHKTGIKTARIFTTLQNLYTFTNYTGMDPEVNYYGVSNIIMGTDFFTYPQSRTILVGFNIGF